MCVTALLLLVLVVVLVLDPAWWSGGVME